VVDISDVHTQPSPATTLMLASEEALLPELKRHIREHPGMLMEPVLGYLGDKVKIPIIFFLLRFYKRFQGVRKEDDLAIMLLREYPQTVFVRDEHDVTLLRYTIEKRNEVVIQAVLDGYLQSVGTAGSGEACNEVPLLGLVDVQDLVLLCRHYPGWANYFFASLQAQELRTDRLEALFPPQRQAFLRGVTGLGWCDRAFWTPDDRLGLEQARAVLDMSCITRTKLWRRLFERVRQVHFIPRQVSAATVAPQQLLHKDAKGAQNFASTSEANLRTGTGQHTSNPTGTGTGNAASGTYLLAEGPGTGEETTVGLANVRKQQGLKAVAVRSLLLPIRQLAAMDPDKRSIHKPMSLLEAMVDACDEVGEGRAGAGAGAAVPSVGLWGCLMGGVFLCGTNNR
jgi:hypothetical protein